MSSFLRYLVSGCVSVGTYVGLVQVLHNWWGIAAMPANLMAYTAATAVNYLLNYFWSFASSARHRQSLPKFLTIVALGYASNFLFVYLTSTVMGLDLRLSALLFAALWPVVSFTAQKRFVFR